MEKVYAKWKTETGIPVEVTLLEFLGYYRHHGSLYKYKDPNTGKEYYGEQYKARKENGDIIYPIIRSEIIEEFSDEANVGWAYNQTPIHDGSPYFHQDTMEEIEANKLLYPREKYNPRLKAFMDRSDLFEQRIISNINTKGLCEVVKKGLTLYLIFHRTPENATKKQFQYWKQEFPVENNLLENILGWY